MKSKTQILKTASTLKQFSTKIRSAQDEVLTPEAVRDMAEEIKEVAEVAAEMAEEIADNVPAEESPRMDDDLREEAEPEQIEVASAEESEEVRRRKMKEGETHAREAREDEDEDEKKKLRMEVASMKNELNNIKRASVLEKLATKYASLFPKSMKEAKMNEILTSKDHMSVIQARVQEASDIITNKTMVKIASMSDSIFDVTDTDSEEVNIAAKL